MGISWFLMDLMGRERERHGEGDTERDRERQIQSLNHLSVHQRVRSAIHASQQLTSPTGFLSLKLPPPPCAVTTGNLLKGNRVSWEYIMMVYDNNGDIWIYDNNPAKL